MSHFDRPGATLEEPVRRRSTGSLFGDLGERLARTFGGVERSAPDHQLPSWGDDNAGDDTVAFEQAPARFPVARVGYDCDSVDHHISELEREITQLRANGSPRQAVAAEIERIGEQTASILKVAHEQAREITRDAQRQADTCLADAAANAVAITEEANRKLRTLDLETEAVWQERTRLIEDARGVATAMFTLAEEAAERFPGESERAPRPASAQPVIARPPVAEAADPAPAPAPAPAPDDQ